MWLSDEAIEELTCLITEFGEDLHNDIGLWAAYERYNIQFYATPLPLTVSNGAMFKTDQFSAPRIQHFLWNIYSELKPDILIPPTMQKLSILSKEIVNFLEKNFNYIPRDSGVKKFLSEPNDYGWDVKKKLIWMGTHSYFFRVHSWNYFYERDEEVSIGLIDDFVAQETTKWSGLGVIDILAEVLNISIEEKKDIQTWYERHASCYKIVDMKKGVMELENIVNNEIYAVMFGDGKNPFKVNHYIFGSLVPYGKYWYWSGEQRVFEKMSEEQIKDIREDLIRRSSNIVYRYDHQLAQKAKEMVKGRYEDFVKFFGNDLVVFPDGLTMATALQKKDRAKFENSPPSTKADMLQHHAPQKSFPEFSLPQDLLEDDTGLGVYFHPDEGEEIMRNFRNVENGFKKKGFGLNEEEQEAIRIFMEADAISLLFVQRIIREYGDESLANSFLIPTGGGKHYIDYLLRRYKGHFYRNRYPAI